MLCCPATARRQGWAARRLLGADRVVPERSRLTGVGQDPMWAAACDLDRRMRLGDCGTRAVAQSGAVEYLQQAAGIIAFSGRLGWHGVQAGCPGKSLGAGCLLFPD